MIQKCDEVVSIPLAAEVESLNVAAAGAIALYERRRRAG
jgi:tRNA G18 (ribose-2'-O)-methylase SpoU